jgi:CDP-glucose 4,6-dehydratase
VLLTGHTGFKGGWAALWLKELGAEVTGLARAPDQTPALFDLARVAKAMKRSVIADLTEVLPLRKAMVAAKPEIVLHMAAQPLVRRSVRDPVETFRSNLMGTVELLEAARRVASVRTILVVTSDKVYANAENGNAFREDDRLGGKDPYSASKAATELAVRAWRETYFARAGVRLASVRGGNVIGGGDFSEDRLVPDAVRAAVSGRPLILRHPDATRPWQHVLDCLAGYLAYVEALHDGQDVPLALNIGPEPGAELAVGPLASRLLDALGVADGWRHEPQPGSIEMKALAIDGRLAGETLGWHGALSMDEAAAWTASWYRAWRDGAEMRAVTLSQIARYTGLNG